MARQALWWLGMGSAVLVAQAAPVATPLTPPLPRAEVASGSRVLDHALHGELAPGARALGLPLESPQGAGGGPPPPIPRPAAAPRTLLPSRAPTTAPPAAQAPGLLQGHLPGLSNPTPARPDTARLARDWSGHGPGAADGGGVAAGPAEPAPHRSAVLAAERESLVWLVQGLALLREHRNAVLAVAAALLLVVGLQSVRARRR